MANTTSLWAQTVGRTDFKSVFRIKPEVAPWYSRCVTVGSTKRGSEEAYSWSAFGTPQQIGELEPFQYEDASELSSTTITVYKYNIGTMLSRELVDDADPSRIRDISKQMAGGLRESMDFLTSAIVSRMYNNAFSSASQAMFDSSALCDSHTLESGDTLDNDLGPSSLDWSTVWDAVKYFKTTALTQSGLYAEDEPDCLICHPSKADVVAKIFDSPGEPDTGDRNANTLKKIDVVYNRHLDSEYWFIQGKKQKQYMQMLWRHKPSVEFDGDFDRQGQKIAAWMRLGQAPLDFTFIVGNPGD